MAIVIDGSRGEGGGQVLRTSLALSLCLEKPFRIVHLRARRPKPGLGRQHLACVRAAARIAGAEVKGAALGSRELDFAPGSIRSGQYHFDIGSAGSTTLLLQAVLPALLRAPGPSTVVVEGGTHNPMAPPFEFLVTALLPLLNRLGAEVKALLERPGYYPRGGGRIRAEIRPARKWEPLQLYERGELLSRRAVAAVAGLPPRIGAREIGVIEKRLGWKKENLSVREEPADWGPGNILLLEIKAVHAAEVASGVGLRGLRAELVAERAAAAARRYLETGVPVGEHLADQLLVPMVVAGGGSFRTLRPSAHTETNVEVIRHFTDLPIVLKQEAADAWQVTVG